MLKTLGRITGSISIVSLLGMLLLISLASVLVGAYELDLEKLGQVLVGEGSRVENYLVWQVRLPRVVLAVAVGGGLAITGAATQGLFRNPLAEPTLIGITSGAMLFAVLALVFNVVVVAFLPVILQQFAVSLFAFFGALLTTILVYRIAKRGGKVNVAAMLLSGIAIAALTGAFTGMLIYVSDEDQLRDITFWTLGSLGGANWTQVLICLPVTLIGGFFLQQNALALNAFLLGEREASQLGFNVQKIKRQIIICVALIVGVSISFTGLIGFVGLVIPHLVRLQLGTDYRKLMACSFLLGGSFLLAADTIARTIVAPAELPIGILTALVGAPFFIWLLLRQRRLTNSLS